VNGALNTSAASSIRSLRRKALHGMLFHNIKASAEDLRAWFDIDLFKSLSVASRDFAIRIFLRRRS
jgi:hypothetical protein